MSPDLGVFLAFLALIRDATGGGGGEGPPGPPGPAADPTAPPAPGMNVPPPPAPTHIPPPGDVGPGTIPSAKPVPSPARPAPIPIHVLPVPVAPPGGQPPMPPWPSPPTPGTLPPFPGPQWCPDTPVTPTVSSRAAYWNPMLWNYGTKTIARPYVQENLGGQWVTFAAAWHPDASGNPKGMMATEAWRVCTAPPVAPPAPAPSSTPVQQAAHAMNQALLSHGYKQADQSLYRAFQSAAGLSADGFPGTHTMGALAATLATMGEPIAPVKIYPWSSTGGYDGVNAPTMAEWTGASPVSPHPTAPTVFTGPPPLVSPYPGTGAYSTNADYITRYQEALTYLAQNAGQPTWNPGGIDGRYGPNTIAAVTAFQAAHGLTADGKAGADTAAALDAAVAATPAAAGAAA